MNDKKINIKILISFLLLIIEVILIQTIDGNTDIGAMIIAIYTTIMYFTIFFMFLPL